MQDLIMPTSSPALNMQDSIMPGSFLLLWDVDIVEIRVDLPICPSPPVVNRKEGRPPVDSPTSLSLVVNLNRGRTPVDAPTLPSPVVNRNQHFEPASPRLSKTESSDSFVSSPPKPDGWKIYYDIADEYGDIYDDIESHSLIFKGTSVQELTHRLEKETGLQGITVCYRNILNDKLYPLCLHLPPNGNGDGGGGGAVVSPMASQWTSRMSDSSGETYRTEHGRAALVSIGWDEEDLY